MLCSPSCASARWMGCVPGGAITDPNPIVELSRSSTRDRADCGHRVVELGVDGAQHLAMGELGHQIVDRLVEAQDALLDQRHRRRGGDRLAQRGDAEDGVSGQRLGLARTRGVR